MCTLQLLLDYSQLPLGKCRMRYTCFNFFFILKFAATLAEGNVLVYGTKELDEWKIYHVDIFTKHRSRWSGISNLFPCSIGRIKTRILSFPSEWHSYKIVPLQFCLPLRSSLILTLLKPSTVCNCSTLSYRNTLFLYSFRLIVVLSFIDLKTQFDKIYTFTKIEGHFDFIVKLYSMRLILILWIKLIVRRHSFCNSANSRS